MHPLIHHTRRDGTPYPPEQSPIYEAMRHRGQAHVDDEVLLAGRRHAAFRRSTGAIRSSGTSEVIGAVVTFLDITERRLAEEEIQEGVRRREQFLAMLSHELRNPLAAILSATRLIDTAGWGDGAAQEAGQVVERQAKHMARLLDDLLDVSRITRGRIVLRNERDRSARHRTVGDRGARAASWRNTRRSSRSTSADERCPSMAIPPACSRCKPICSATRRKYSSSGGHVRFELHREDGEAMIRVTDDGCGIEPEMLPRIFDLFVQGDQSIARSEGGLGIGLTLLRSLVELHSGRVEARSEGAGRGSAFTVWLPLATT